MDNLGIISTTSNLRTEEILRSERVEKQHEERIRALDEYRRESPEYRPIKISYEPITIEVTEFSKTNVKLYRNEDTYIQMSNIEKSNIDITILAKTDIVKVNLSNRLQKLIKILEDNTSIELINNQKAFLHNIKLLKGTFNMKRREVKEVNLSLPCVNNITVLLDTLKFEKMTTYSGNNVSLFISEILHENFTKIDWTSVIIFTISNNFSYIKIQYNTDINVSIKPRFKEGLVLTTNAINVEISYEKVSRDKNSCIINVDKFLKLNINPLISLKNNRLTINKFLSNSVINLNLSTILVELTDYRFRLSVKYSLTRTLSNTKRPHVIISADRLLHHKLECKVNLNENITVSFVGKLCRSSINKQALSELNLDFQYKECIIQNISTLTNVSALLLQKQLERTYKILSLAIGPSRNIKGIIENIESEITFEFISKTLGNVSCNFSCIIIVVYPESKEQMFINGFIGRLLRRFKNVLEAYAIPLPELSELNYLSNNFKHIVFSEIETNVRSKSFKNSIVVRTPSVRVFWEYLRLTALKSALEVPNCTILLVPCKDPSKMFYELVKKSDAGEHNLIMFLKRSIGYFIPVVIVYLDKDKALRILYNKLTDKLAQL